jgi:O-acetyl-ADP-ribose deacetylase (regulator of RNase III)
MRLIRRDIFSADVDAIVNPVNCYGVMGKGLALQFKINYPENFNQYKIACDTDKVQIGRVFRTKAFDRYIFNFPTKKHWSNKSRLSYIEAGLKDLVNQIKFCNIKSIALPQLGCGLGGLDWQEVKPLIQEIIPDTIDTRIYLR